MFYAVDPVETMKQKLSERTNQIILGSILGDGSLKIQNKYRNARFSFRHSIIQQEYFFWKIRELVEVSARSVGGYKRQMARVKIICSVTKAWH